MLDHIGVGVSNLAASRDFFLAVLAPLKARLIMEFQGHVGIGRDGKPTFWISQTQETPAPLHLAFTANSRADVDAFYQAALAAGGRDNGPPGIRAQYHPDYYGAFVIGPDGHNVEAVCHRPE